MSRATLENIRYITQATAAHEIALAKGIPPAPASAEARRMAAARRAIEDRKDLKMADDYAR